MGVQEWIWQAGITPRSSVRGKHVLHSIGFPRITLTPGTRIHHYWKQTDIQRVFPSRRPRAFTSPYSNNGRGFLDQLDGAAEPVKVGNTCTSRTHIHPGTRIWNRLY